jgi:hypothetical protein
MADEPTDLILPILREMRAEAAAFRTETLAAFVEVRAFRAETVAAFVEVRGSLAEVRATQAEHSRRLADLGVAVSYAVQSRAGDTLAEIALGSRLDAMEARLAAAEARLDGRG